MGFSRWHIERYSGFPTVEHFKESSQSQDNSLNCRAKKNIKSKFVHPSNSENMEYFYLPLFFFKFLIGDSGLFETENA